LCSSSEDEGSYYHRCALIQGYMKQTNESSGDLLSGPGSATFSIDCLICYTAQRLIQRMFIKSSEVLCHCWKPARSHAPITKEWGRGMCLYEQLLKHPHLSLAPSVASQHGPKFTQLLASLAQYLPSSALNPKPYKLKDWQLCELHITRSEQHMRHTLNPVSMNRS